MNVAGTSFNLDLPTGWVCEIEDEYTIYQKDGVGCVQISEYSTPTLTSREELVELASEYVVTGVPLQDLSLGAFQGISLSFDDEEGFSQHWYVAYKHSMLFITYTCATEDRNVELADVLELLKLIKAT